MRFYITWHNDQTAFPTNREERAKLGVSLVEMVKADMKAGLTKDWGASASGRGGYAIYEATSETAIGEALQKYRPYIVFDSVEPIITADQVIESFKKATAKK